MHRNAVQYVSTCGSTGRTKATSHGGLEEEYELKRFITWQHQKKLNDAVLKQEEECCVLEATE
jgi:hypothetical protein